MEIDNYNFDGKYCVVNCPECGEILLINMDKFIDEYYDYKSHKKKDLMKWRDKLLKEKRLNG